MDLLTRAMAALLRQSAGLLPAERRAWAHAALAEMDDVPPGRQRLSWLAGALWTVVRQAGLIRRVAIDLLAVGGSLAIVIFGWHGGWTNPATPVNRFFLISAVLVLLALPLVVGTRRLFGPVAANTAARVVRIGGYTCVIALLPIVIAVGNFAANRFATCGICSAEQQTQWYDDRVGDAIGGSLLIFVVVMAYAGLVLWLTSRRAAVTATSMVVGAVCASIGGITGYALAPAGAAWDVGIPWLTGILVVLLLMVAAGTPFVSGLLTASRVNSADAAIDLQASRGRQAVLAGVLAASGGLLIFTILSIPTMVVFPGSVPLEWANPSPAVPHGTPFELQLSVGDAAVRYLWWMVLAPILGACLGAAGAGAGAIKAARTTAPVPANN